MYHPTAAGHAVRESPQNITQETIDEKLVDLAKKFLDGREQWYTVALKMTEHVTTTAHAAGLLALHPVLQEHKNCRRAGAFISALWNEHCPENVIVYPHNTPRILDLGLYLSPGKELIITGTTGDYTGDDMRGTLVVQGTTGGFTGAYNHGLVIIVGRAGVCTGEDSLGTIIISGTTDVRTGQDGSGTLITTTSDIRAERFLGTRVSKSRYERNKPLKTYVGHLLDLATHNPEAIGQELGSAMKITAAIKERLRRKR